MFQQLPSVSNGAYKVSSLTCDQDFSAVSNQQDYGLDSSTETVLVNVGADKILLSWSALDPATNSGANLNDGIFSHFKVELVDETNSLVETLDASSVDAFYELDCSILKFLSIRSFSDENALRNCRIRISSYTLDGNTSAGVFLLRFPASQFSNVSVTSLTNIFANFSLSNRQYVKTISLQKSSSPSFSRIDDFVELAPSSSVSYAPITSDKAYYRLVSNDYYSTGVPYSLGQIKCSTINTLKYDLRPANISGAIYIGYDTVAQTYNRQLFAKWARNVSDSPIDYEVHVYRSGVAGPHDVYYYNNPKIEKIQSIVYGTGTSLRSYGQSGVNAFYSGSSYVPVFSPHQTSGIAWSQHTVFLDEKGSFPAGSYAQDSIAELNSIAFATGSIVYPKAYLVYYYDSNADSFIYFPSGSYSSGIYGSQFSGSTSGIGYFRNYTGILVAERFDFTSPSGSAVVAGIEPYFFIPIEESANYQVKVRGVLSDSAYTEFSDIVNFSREAIDAATLLVNTPSADNGTCLTDAITQSGHGFIIGDVIRYDITGQSWKKAIATTAEYAEAAGIVQSSTANAFNIIYEGKITGLSGLSGGCVYFLSPSVSGQYTATEPSVVGQVSKPILLASSVTEGTVLSYRGYIVDNEAGYDASTNVFVDASRMFPGTTSGCATAATVESSSNRVNYRVLDFDPTNRELAYFTQVMPNNWNNGSVTAKFYWTTTGTTGGVVFGIQALSLANATGIDSAFGSPQYVADTVLGANLTHITSGSDQISIAGTAAAENPIIFRISREPANASDTLSSDARLFGVEIGYS